MPLEVNINLPTLFLLHNLKRVSSLVLQAPYSNFIFCLPLILKRLLQAEISAKMFCNFVKVCFTKFRVKRYQFTIYQHILAEVCNYLNENQSYEVKFLQYHKSRFSYRLHVVCTEQTHSYLRPKRGKQTVQNADFLLHWFLQSQICPKSSTLRELQKKTFWKTGPLGTQLQGQNTKFILKQLPC